MKKAFQELTRNELGQLQGGFVIQSGMKTKFGSTNTNCGGGFFDRNENCKCTNCGKPSGPTTPSEPTPIDPTPTDPTPQIP